MNKRTHKNPLLLENIFSIKKRWIFFSISTLLLCSCQTNLESERLEFTQFPIEKSVILDSIQTEPVLYCLGDMLMTDSMLVTLDLKCDTFFRYFRLPDLHYLGASTIKGGGPNDEVAIFPTLQNRGENKFAYRSVSSVKEVKYDYIQQTLQATRVYAVPAAFANILNSILSGDALIGYGMMDTAPKEYKKLALTDNTISDFGPDYPKVGIQADDHLKNVLFSKTLTCSPNDSLIAALYDKFPLLRIYNSQGKVIAETLYDNQQPQPKGYDSPNGPGAAAGKAFINYLKLKVTNHYIYGLYVGKTHNELPPSMDGLVDIGREIHVWDWQGRPMARFLLNRTVSNFAVAPDDSRLLLYTYTDEDCLYTLQLTLH